MSVEATHWVYTRNLTSRGNDRLVLLALADEADTGTGACFPSVDLLAHKTRADRTTVMDCIVRLECDGQLLVKRPEKRGRGRHNRYVVVMDRDPYELADNIGWSRPPLTPAAQARRASALAAAITEDVPSSEEHDQGVPSPEITDGHRTSQPGVPSPETSDSPTIPTAERSENGRTMVAPGPTIPSPNPENPSVQRARPTLPVDNLPSAVRDLAERLAAVGHVTRWDLRPQQIPLVEAQLVVLGVDALIDAAMLEAARKGTPRSARAWVDSWTALVPPLGSAASRNLHAVADGGPRELRPPCGHCDPNRWITDHHGLPVAKCPTCHPAFAGHHREERHA